MTPATLRKLEWSCRASFGTNYCPACENLESSGTHAPDCELDAAIREAEQAEKGAAIQRRINEHLDVCIYCDPGLTTDCKVGSKLLAEVALWRQEPLTPMTDAKRKRKRVARTRLVIEPGYVWCDRHGCIHDDSLDPYEMGGEDRCDPAAHRPVYVRQQVETSDD